MSLKLNQQKKKKKRKRKHTKLNFSVLDFLVD